MQKPGTRSSAYLACRRWTPEEASQALAALEQSGLELTAFAIREGLDPQRLSRWRRRLAASMPVFEEVITSEVIAAGAATHERQERFEIVLASGRVVRVPESFDAGALRRLLAIVDEVRPC
jgi:transposase-like protein